MRNNNLIHINNLDGEIRDLLLSVNPNTATIEALLSHYFDKDNDKILISNIDTSVVQTFNDYADDNDKVLLNEINKCRLRNDPIKRSDLDSELLQTIENNTLSIAAIGGLLKSTGGGQIDISALSNEINTLKHTVNDGNLATKDDVAKAKQETIDEAKLAINGSINGLNSSMVSTNKTIEELNKKLNTVNTDILNNQNDIEKCEKTVDTLNTNVNSIIKRCAYKKTNIFIAQDNAFTINTEDPFSYNIKLYVYDNDTESSTYQHYVDAGTMLSVSYQYKTLEDDLSNKTDSTSSASTDSSDGDGSGTTVSDGSTETGTDTTTKQYNIIIKNVSGHDINAKIIYQTSLDEKIETNITSTSTSDDSDGTE